MDGNLLLIGVSEPGVQSWGSYYFSDAREDRCWCWVTFVVPGFSLDAGLLAAYPPQRWVAAPCASPKMGQVNAAMGSGNSHERQSQLVQASVSR